MNVINKAHPHALHCTSIIHEPEQNEISKLLREMFHLAYFRLFDFQL